jgi:hypothetical protein
VGRLLESLGDAWRAINTDAGEGEGEGSISSSWLNSPAGHIALGAEPHSAIGGWSA